MALLGHRFQETWKHAHSQAILLVVDVVQALFMPEDVGGQAGYAAFVQTHALGVLEHEFGDAASMAPVKDSARLFALDHDQSLLVKRAQIGFNDN